MFNHLNYVPILKWKQGEYQALLRLDDRVKDKVTPLIEIPPIPMDHAKGVKSETLDSYLSDFGKKLKDKWKDRLCFVDVGLLGYGELTQNKSLCVGHVLNLARQNGCKAIPVIGLPAAKNEKVVATLSAAIATDGNGVCIRVVTSDFDATSISNDITEMMRALKVGFSSVDLLVDFKAGNYSSITLAVANITQALEKLPSVNQFRTFTVAGTSFPTSIADIMIGSIAEQERSEWRVYKEYVSKLDPAKRIPTYSDYGVTGDDHADLDMRMIKPMAKLKYTTEKSWLISKGKQVRKHGFEQYREMCAALVARKEYDGEKFSAGDAYIKGCASGTESTGNLTTWVWVATNRHVTRVAFDLANLHGV